MAELYRYAAFISYSSKDATFARRLHRALESYGIPASLGKFDLTGAGKQNRIYPVFRDREELSAGHLGDLIEANLKASAALVVVCSPNSAASPWVEKEIEFFARLGRRDKIFAIISDSAPVTDESGADATASCFPPLFRGDALSGDALEPLAADARTGKDGFRNAWLKIVAGMIGVSPGQIIDRDRKRQAQRRAAMIGGAAALAVAAGLASSWTSTLSWRSQFTERASQAALEGNLLDAAALALAGGNGGGAIVSARARRADAVLADVSGARIVGNAPYRPPLPFSDPDLHVAVAPSDILFSEDGTTAAIASPTGLVTLFDTRGGLAPLTVEGRTAILRARGDVALVLRRERGPFGPEDLIVVRKEPGGWRSENLGPHKNYDFSLSGRFLAVVTADHVARLHDMDGGAPLTLNEAERASVSGDGGTFVVTRLDGESVAMRGGAVTELPRGFVILPQSGARVVVVGREMIVSRDLEAGAPPYQVGNYGMNLIFPPRLTADGSALIVSQAQDRCMAFNLADRRLQQQIAGGCSDFLPSRQTLVARTRTGEYRDASIFPAGPERVLGRLGEHTHFMPGAGMYVAEQLPVRFEADAEDVPLPTLRALPIGGGEEKRFPEATGWLVANDGSHLLVANGEDVAIYRMPAAERLLNVSFSSYRRIAFSGDGGTLVVDMRNGQARLHNLNDRTTRALGSIGGLRTEIRGAGRLGFIVLSRDGAAMAVSNENSTATVFDLAAPAPNARAGGELRRGGDLADNVCAANGAVVPPFSAGTRSAGELARTLRGRPWHACDWRGLLAIVPNATRGDGWFEGARQWIRLVHVRYFGGADWTCAETTSAASEQVRGRREEACRNEAAQTTS
jgi:hypothetical protein